MSLENTLRRGGPLTGVLILVLVALAIVTTVATIYTAWLIAGLLVTGLLKQVVVTLGILGLASASASS